MPTGYAVLNTAAVALVAATAKSILSVIQGAGVAARITELAVSFDGVAAANTPVLVELCQSTQATTGTSTAFTPVLTRGQVRTVQSTAAVNYTAEPTVLTVIKTWLIHPQTSYPMQLPLSREPERVGAGAFVLRCTAPQAVNVRAHVEFEEG